MIGGQCAMREARAAVRQYFMPVRFVIAWALYFAGDLVWRVCDDWLDLFSDRGPGQWLFRAYQGLMAAAARVQGDGPGPWEKAL